MIIKNKITHLILVLSYIGFTSACHGQEENSWLRLADFGGLQRERAVGFSIGNYGYITTGLDTAEQTKKDLWQYDPELNSWTQMSDFPGIARKDAIAFTINNKGFVGTGFSHDDSEIGTYLNDMWCYSPTSNTWDSIAPYPGGDGLGVSNAASFAIAENGYVACGKIGSNDYISDLWEYNSIEDVWTIRIPFPGGDRQQLIAMSLLEKGYVGLGTDHDIHRKDFWMYDPITGLWESKSDFVGTERALSSSFTLAPKGYIVFGLDGGYKDELWEYNPYDDTWRIKAPFPGGGRKNGIAFSINNVGYAGIGKEIDGKKRSFYAYHPNLPLSIDENNNSIQNLFPNPADDLITLQLKNTFHAGKIKIIDINGRLVMDNYISDNDHTININGINKGTYFIIIQMKK